VVRVATCKKDNKKYAIKVYDKSKLTDSNRQRSVRREIKLLQKMNHPNIVKIFEAFETDDYVYLVMEYVGGGSLHSYLREKPNRRLEEDDAKRIFKQIMTALHYCHRKSIAHRDIKLENILLDENNNVKLIDFGFSTCIPNDKKIKMFCGTPSYMGPEIVLKEEYAGPPADIWASAVLLYALLNGCFPFRGATDKELYRRIQRGTFELHNSTVSD
jgi:serine/threonine protein kinase